MKIIYKHQAVIDIQQMQEYIANVLKNKTAARNFSKRILKDISILKTNPYIGVSVQEKFLITASLRMLVVDKQLVFYEVIDEETVTIIRVLDGRQDYLAILLG